MNAAAQAIAHDHENLNVRRVAESDDPTIFTDIYREDTNITIWKRQLSSRLQKSIEQFIEKKSDYQFVSTVSPDSAHSILNENLFELNYKTELVDNITELVDMFCYLFDLKQAGLRLTTLDRAMCPRFHFDRVPCRLVCTYHGKATEWLSHHVIDRSKLGAGNNGLSDEESGLFQNKQDIKKVNAGDVALLKGTLWEGNEDAGLVHRSPAIGQSNRRLLLTLDFII